MRRRRLRNIMKRIMKSKKKRFIQEGFTLIELLTAIAVFGIIGTIAVSVIVIALQGSTKSEVLTTVKQNGTYALSQMVRSIRYAKSLDSPNTCVPSVNLTSLTITSGFDLGQTTYSCPTATSTTISSNSASLVDTSAVSVKSCSITCIQNTSADPPTVTIKFTLTGNNASGFVERVATVPFESSVTMRNFVAN